MRRKQEIASKRGRGYRTRRPYRLMLDCSSPIKLGDRPSLFNAAFSMAQRSMIADIALTSWPRRGQTSTTLEITAGQLGNPAKPCYPPVSGRAVAGPYFLAMWNWPIVRAWPSKPTRTPAIVYPSHSIAIISVAAISRRSFCQAAPTSERVVNRQEIVPKTR